jgi:hypothetical protein
LNIPPHDPFIPSFLLLNTLAHTSNCLDAQFTLKNAHPKRQPVRIKDTEQVLRPPGTWLCV